MMTLDIIRLAVELSAEKVESTPTLPNANGTRSATVHLKLEMQ